MEIDPKVLEAQDDYEMSADAIPDLDVITHEILNMIEFMDTKEMINKRKKDIEEFTRVLYAKYRDVISTKMIDLLIEDRVKNENVNFKKLIDMFSTMSQIKAGHLDMKQEYEKFTESVNEEYVFKKYGGRDGFMQHLQQCKAKKE